MIGEYFLISYLRCISPILFALEHRGSSITSRLANYFPERFLAYGFLNVPYVTPNPDYDIDRLVALTKKVMGYETYGYWFFFSEEDAPKLMREHVRRIETVKKTLF